jgi:hypothetical protein
MFIENDGQFDPLVKFQLGSGDTRVYLASEAIWINMLEPKTLDEPVDEIKPGAQPTPTPGFQWDGDKARPRKGVSLRFEFLEANPQARIEGFDPLDTKVSFFTGNNPEKWHPDVPVWGGVRYVDMYPGVDLDVTGYEGKWEWQLVVQDENRFQT